MKYVLALDQGTTSSRAIVFDQIGQIVGKAQREFKQIYPEPGWVEHDPKDIFSSQVGVIPEAIADAGITAADITAVGITNQRETTIVWEKSTGKPVYNAIVWQCRRTASYCDSLRKKYAKTIYKKTGLILDAYFSATKIKWILDNVPGAREKAENGQLLFGTVDTFLMWNLSQGKIFATDYTNASRTMLFNVHTLDWDDELLSIFGVPRSMLPSVYPSSHFFGTTEPTVAGGLSAKITGVAGDQQAALFGHLATSAGDVKNTYGTGCFLLMNTGSKAVASKNGLVTTLAACRDGEKPCYVLEGSVFVGGAVVQWLRDEMKLVDSAAETEQIATSVSSSNGVYVVPAFTGLGAPHWDSAARGTVTGITRGTSRAHFVRAALESVAYEVSDIVFAMQNDSGVKLNTLNVDGGASANNFLMQLQSDLLCAKVVRPTLTETTALGACYLAGLGAGVWKSIDEIKSNVTVDREFVPSMDESKRKELLDGWKKAVRQAKAK